MKNNRKGFTLAELLIVVAIIAVLVAIAIPVFTTQLEKSREATDIANVRSAYATLVADFLDSSGEKTAEVPVQQKVEGWQTTPAPELQVMVDGKTEAVKFEAKTSGKYTGSLKTVDGKLTVTVD